MKKELNAIKKLFYAVGIVLMVLVTILASIIHFSVKWMFKTWNHLTMDELIYHLKAPMDGTNEGMIEEYINVCIVPTVLILMAVIIVLIAIKGKRRIATALISVTVSTVVIGLSVSNVWNTLDVSGYVESKNEESDFIKNYYVSPDSVEIVFPEQKRNLIYIFLESMEITYADEENGGAFEENVIPELTKLAQENEDFSGENNNINGGYALTGATWTMGAMFAHTSGIPLEIGVDGNNMDVQDSFFSSVISIGDILEEAGYSQTLLIGSEAVFGGRKLYFTEHGNYEMMDYVYAQDNGLIPEDYRVFWGYEDAKLFEFAKEKLSELSENEQPFNLTMLTVDTHFEDGYICEICENEFEDAYSNVMKCSSKQVFEFVQWIQEQPFYENTTIVLVGDHPTMDSDFCEGIDSSYSQRVYTAFINSAVGVEEKVERIFSTFDFYPTSLAALGVSIEGERLGLGTNLFSITPTLLERFGVEKVESELSKKSEFMEELANIDYDKEGVILNDTDSNENEQIPSAEVTVGEYQFMNGILPVEITNVLNVPGNIESVVAAVWTESDQSDLRWTQAEVLADNQYHVDIYVPEYGYKTGEYIIHIYAINDIGEQYIIAETTGMVN